MICTRWTKDNLISVKLIIIELKKSDNQTFLNNVKKKQKKKTLGYTLDTDKYWLAYDWCI